MFSTFLTRKLRFGNFLALGLMQYIGNLVAYQYFYGCEIAPKAFLYYSAMSSTGIHLVIHCMFIISLAFSVIHCD